MAEAQPVPATFAAVEATATAAGPHPPYPVSYAALPGWPGDDPAATLPALLGSCRELRGWPADRPLGGHGELARLGGRSVAWEESCAEVAALAERLRHPLQPPLPTKHPARRMRSSAPAEKPLAAQMAEPLAAPAEEPVPARAAGPLPARIVEPVPARAVRPPRSRAAEARARVAAEAAWQATEDAERQALVRDLLERCFQPFAAGPGLLTGYYEPELRGAQYPASPFLVPLHGMPPAEPPPGQPPGHAPGRTPGPGLPDRTAIGAGALEGQGLELAWVDDPVDAFFLHIQGSGRVRLHDGRLLRLGYAGQNGHPYGAIGRSLIERGFIAREVMSMQAIRAWLAAAAPGEAAVLLRQNPSYVFFRRLEGLRPDQGPPGAMGVPLTPGRSIAVDPAHVPYGAPVFAASRDPLDGSPLHRLLVAQDTGGAIRGQGRGDVFWGWGEAAAARAGRMRERAEVFVLVPREPARAEDGEILAVEEVTPAR